MAVYEIPLAGIKQTFGISLAGVAYTMTVRSNPWAQAWYLDIADDTGAKILSGIPLVTGTDLLGQFTYLDFGGQLIVQTDHDPLALPTYQNLGSNSRLYFVTPS